MNNNITKSALPLTINSEILNIDANDYPFKIMLKRHQLALLYKILNVEQKIRQTNFPYAMMSDKPGSGKSFTILAFIYYSMLLLDSSQGCSLIIVPQNIYLQWINSIDSFLSTM